MIRLLYFIIRYPLYFLDFFRSSRKYLRDNRIKIIFVLLITPIGELVIGQEHFPVDSAIKRALDRSLNGDSAIWIYNDSIGVQTLPFTYPKQESNQDTVRVFYLISDTSESGVYYMNFSAAYSTFGYEVRLNEYALFLGIWKHTHLQYLDYNKTPFPKNIVIWQAKEMVNIDIIDAGKSQGVLESGKLYFINEYDDIDSSPTPNSFQIIIKKSIKAVNTVPGKAPIDSTKYYWQQSIKLHNKGVPDSLNKYIKLLNPKQKINFTSGTHKITQ